jgi:hypothetical protein
MAVLSEEFISQSPIRFKLDLNHARVHLLDDLGSAILTRGVCNDDIVGPSDALYGNTNFFRLVIRNDVRSYFLHLAVLCQIPIHKPTHALFDRRIGLKADPCVQLIRIGCGCGHVAHLHRQIILHRGLAHGTL